MAESILADLLVGLACIGRCSSAFRSLYGRRRPDALAEAEVAAHSINGSAEINFIVVTTVTSKFRPDEKVKLFRSLFRGREDVYASRWKKEWQNAASDESNRGL